MKHHLSFRTSVFGCILLFSEASSCLAGPWKMQYRIKNVDNSKVSTRYLTCLLRQNEQINIAYRDSRKFVDKAKFSRIYNILACDSGTRVNADRSYSVDINNTFTLRKESSTKHCCQATVHTETPVFHERAGFDISQAKSPFVANGIYPYGL